MDQIYKKYQDIKFSSLNQNTLGVLSNRDIQIYKLDTAGSERLALQQIVEIGQVTTFEWQKCLSKNQHSQYILAAHQNGKISLLNTSITSK